MKEIDERLTALLPADFLLTTPQLWFAHLPRYLRALQRRLERMGVNQSKDAELSKSLAPIQKAANELTGRTANQPELDRLKWMIEELRVSLFAQTIGTPAPVSERRIMSAIGNLA